MSRLSIGRLIAIAMVITTVLLLSIDTAFACRYLWRSHYRSCAPVYYCPPAPCRVVTTPSCGSTAPAPVIVHESSELPEPPPAEVLESADAMQDAPSDDTGFTDPLEPDDMDSGDPTESLVDEPEIVDDLPDVMDDPGVTDLPADTATDLPEETTTDFPADDTDPLGDIFDEPADNTLPDDTSVEPADDTDPLGDIFDEPADDTLPNDTSDVPAADDDPLGDIFDEPLDGGTGPDEGLPTDGTDDSLDDIFDEPLPGDGGAASGSADEELMNDLFGGEPADTAEPRVANNPDEDDDELFRELEEARDLDADLDADLPADDLEADELFPLEDGDGTSNDAIDDDLNDLFSGLPDKESLGFHEGDVAETRPVEPVVENKPESDINVAPRQGVTRNVEQFKPSVRVWTDNTGMYTTVGRLVKIGESHVRLLKENGRFSTVPKRRLSQADLAYVQEMVKYLGIEELDYVARR